MDTIQVLVGLRDPLLREGVARVLESTEDCRVLAFAGTSEEAVAALREREPDVALVDVRFQREDAGFLASLHDTRRDTAILVCVDHTEEECILRSMTRDTEGWSLTEDAVVLAGECCLLALRHDAMGCVPREATPGRLLEAIRAVAGGEVAAEEWAVARWIQTPRADRAGANRRITCRELEIIRLVADGLTNRAIADRVGLREQTVKNHMARIMEKLGAHNRVQVALVARERHLT